MIIKDKKIVELLKKKKAVAEKGIVLAKEMDEIAKKFEELKKDEQRCVGQINELTLKINNIIWKNYLSTLADEENFGEIKLIDDEIVDIAVFNQIDIQRKKFVEDKKQVVNKAKGVVK